jgi:hypothetical protein
MADEPTLAEFLQRNALDAEIPSNPKAGVKDLVNKLWGAAQRAYDSPLPQLPEEPNARFQAMFGADPRLGWLDFHDQTMRNFVGRARNAIPGAWAANEAYRAYYDPDHPVTQQNQSTKDAAILAGLGAAQVAMPWAAPRLARGMAVPPSQSRHPNQSGENAYMALPPVGFSGAYGIGAPSSMLPPLGLLR